MNSPRIKSALHSGVEKVKYTASVAFDHLGQTLIVLLGLIVIVVIFQTQEGKKDSQLDAATATIRAQGVEIGNLGNAVAIMRDQDIAEGQTPPVPTVSQIENPNIKVAPFLPTSFSIVLKGPFSAGNDALACVDATGSNKVYTCTQPKLPTTSTTTPGG